MSLISLLLAILIGQFKSNATDLVSYWAVSVHDVDSVFIANEWCLEENAASGTSRYLASIHTVNEYTSSIAACQVEIPFSIINPL